jgi:hypothetical protein
MQGGGGSCHRKGQPRFYEVVLRALQLACKVVVVVAAAAAAAVVVVAVVAAARLHIAVQGSGSKGGQNGRCAPSPKHPAHKLEVSQPTSRRTACLVFAGITAVVLVLAQVSGSGDYLGVRCALRARRSFAHCSLLIAHARAHAHRLAPDCRYEEGRGGRCSLHKIARFSDLPAPCSLVPSP